MFKWIAGCKDFDNICFQKRNILLTLAARNMLYFLLFYRLVLSETDLIGC